MLTRRTSCESSFIHSARNRNLPYNQRCFRLYTVLTVPMVFGSADEPDGGKQEGVGSTDVTTSRTDDEEEKQVCGQVWGCGELLGQYTLYF